MPYCLYYQETHCTVLGRFIHQSILILQLKSGFSQHTLDIGSSPLIQDPLNRILYIGSFFIHDPIFKILYTGSFIQDPLYRIRYTGSFIQYPLYRIILYTGSFIHIFYHLHSYLLSHTSISFITSIQDPLYRILYIGSFIQNPLSRILYKESSFI